MRCSFVAVRVEKMKEISCFGFRKISLFTRWVDQPEFCFTERVSNNLESLKLQFQFSFSEPIFEIDDSTFWLICSSHCYHPHSSFAPPILNPFGVYTFSWLFACHLDAFTIKKISRKIEILMMTNKASFITRTIKKRHEIIPKTCTAIYPLLWSQTMKLMNDWSKIWWVLTSQKIANPFFIIDLQVLGFSRPESCESNKATHNHWFLDTFVTSSWRRWDEGYF